MKKFLAIFTFVAVIVVGNTVAMACPPGWGEITAPSGKVL